MLIRSGVIYDRFYTWWFQDLEVSEFPVNPCSLRIMRGKNASLGDLTSNRLAVWNLYSSPFLVCKVKYVFLADQKPPLLWAPAPHFAFLEVRGQQNNYTEIDHAGLLEEWPIYMNDSLHHRTKFSAMSWDALIMKRAIVGSMIYKLFRPRIVAMFSWNFLRSVLYATMRLIYSDRWRAPPSITFCRGK